WTIDEIAATGFYSAGESEFWGVRFYADAGGMPGTVLATETVPVVLGDPLPAGMLSAPVVLTEGAYWVSIYGIHTTAVDLGTFRWNWYASEDPGVGFEPYLIDEAGFFGFLPWTSFTDLGLIPPFNNLMFQLYGTSGGGTVSIAYAIEDLDGDFIPDHLGETVTVEGVVFSPNFQTSNNSFYIWDEVTTSSSGASRGTDIFMFGPPVFDWQPGDLLQITGEVDQFNGMTEIIPADSSGWVLVSSGNPTPDLIELTLAQYKADPEAYEGSLVGFISLTLVGGTWPTGGSSVNLDFSDGIDTCVFRIDSDTDIGGQPEPVWPRDIIGVGSQFDSSPPFDSGYQIFPRYYATDFLPPNTIPVELTSFTAQANDGAVYLNWTTATEQNNQGFEVQRSTNNQFTTIGFISGSGTTTEIHNYSFTDTDVQTGTYYYRLKQVDYNGVYDYSDVIQVDVAPVNFVLEQNYPNPFNPSTKITFSLAVDSKVSLKVFDVLGQEVTKLITTNMTAGVHEVIFDASSLNSGVYFYQLEATASDGTNFTSVKKMILTK
ncbi:MAG: T9SS type A sorting domain-containing protein, partial [Bacteroidetes bacterium]|nr:T9SS type A sorting domain-containing protein [Bacteroidota bacterium]